MLKLGLLFGARAAVDYLEQLTMLTTNKAAVMKLPNIEFLLSDPRQPKQKSLQHRNGEVEMNLILVLLLMMDVSGHVL